MIKGIEIHEEPTNETNHYNSDKNFFVKYNQSVPLDMKNLLHVGFNVTPVCLIVDLQFFARLPRERRNDTDYKNTCIRILLTSRNMNDEAKGYAYIANNINYGMCATVDSVSVSYLQKMTANDHLLFSLQQEEYQMNNVVVSVIQFMGANQQPKSLVTTEVCD